MEADEQLDRDSTFGGDRESIASSSQSLDSEATRYVHEFGRRYHGYQAGKYNFPNDEREQNRMDVEHHNQRLQMDGKLHLCPMDDPKQILDLGCGSGIWAMDMADEYPACQVIGTDLSPIQPIWVPPNCKFEVDDFELEWTFGEARFDMIHERFLMGSISSHTELYKNIYSALKPGGWFELVEMETLTFSDDGTVAEDSACNQWGRLQMEAFAKMGKRMPPASDYEPLLKESGFVNIKTQIMKRPTNDWPRDPRMKDIGRYSCLNSSKVLKALQWHHSRELSVGRWRKCRFCVPKYGQKCCNGKSTVGRKGSYAMAKSRWTRDEVDLG